MTQVQSFQINTSNAILPNLGGILEGFGRPNRLNLANRFMLKSTRKAFAELLADFFRKGRVYRQKGGCWLWRGRLDKDKYGEFPVGPKMEKAHRFVYELLVKPIPVGKQLHHLCGVRHCVSPFHLMPAVGKLNKAIRDLTQKPDKLEKKREAAKAAGHVLVPLCEYGEEPVKKQKPVESGPDAVEALMQHEEWINDLEKHPRTGIAVFWTSWLWRKQAAILERLFKVGALVRPLDSISEPHKWMTEVAYAPTLPEHFELVAELMSAWRERRAKILEARAKRRGIAVKVC